MNLPDASKVVDPAASLRGEIKGLTDTLADMDGKLLEIIVQRKRLEVLRDCMVAGFKVTFGEDPVEGQLDLPLGAEN